MAAVSSEWTAKGFISTSVSHVSVSENAAAAFEFTHFGDILYKC